MDRVCKPAELFPLSRCILTLTMVSANTLRRPAYWTTVVDARRKSDQVKRSRLCASGDTKSVNTTKAGRICKLTLNSRTNSYYIQSGETTCALSGDRYRVSR